MIRSVYLYKIRTFDFPTCLNKLKENNIKVFKFKDSTKQSKECLKNIKNLFYILATLSIPSTFSMF